MNALINLDHINRLDAEINIYEYTLVTSCFGWNNPNEPAGDDLVRIAKVYHQADNLVNQLNHLYEVCQDFVNGAFKTYEEEAAESGHPFNPFVKLGSFLVGTIISPTELKRIKNPYVLPARIEQYAELLAEVRGFSDSHQDWVLTEKELGVKTVEGRICVYEENAQTLIYQMEIEQCLDGYNEFYQQAYQWLVHYHQSGDVKACAAEILRLFEPR